MQLQEITVTGSRIIQSGLNSPTPLTSVNIGDMSELQPTTVADQLNDLPSAACRGHHIGVTVLDAAGYPKLIYIPDGSYGFHAYMSFRKANTAVKFRMPSGKVAAATKTDPALAAKYRAGAADVITFAGGLPIWSGKKLLGAVGVSGAGPSEIDEGCAAAAIKAARPLLKRARPCAGVPLSEAVRAAAPGAPRPS